MAVESTLPNFLIACLIPYCAVTVHLALSFPLTAYFQILSCLTHLSTCFLEGPGNWAAWAETMCGLVGGSAAVQRIAYAYSRISNVVLEGNKHIVYLNDSPAPCFRSVRRYGWNNVAG